MTTGTNNGIKRLGILIGIVSSIWLLTVVMMFKNSLIPILVMGVIPVTFLLIFFWVVKGFLEKDN